MITVVATTVALSVIGIWWMYRYLTSSWRGTTLTASASWAIAAVIGERLWSVGIAADLMDATLPARLLIGGLFLTPTIALLGAKRPQHKAWQWIVLSAWGVLVLPAAESWLYRRSVDVGLVRSWFMVLLLALGLFNHLFTRYWPAALACTLWQMQLLSPFLPVSLPWLSDELTPVAVCLLLVMNIVFARGKTLGPAWHSAWLDFRDAFGAVWALRVVQRLNATAEQNGWPERLGWYGLDSPAEKPVTEAPLTKDLSPSGSPSPQFLRELRSLMARFVTPAWLVERAPDMVE